MTDSESSPVNITDMLQKSASMGSSIVDAPLLPGAINLLEVSPRPINKFDGANKISASVNNSGSNI